MEWLSSTGDQLDTRSGRRSSAPLHTDCTQAVGSLAVAACGCTSAFFASTSPQCAPRHLASFTEPLLGELHTIGRDGNHVGLTIHFDLALDRLVELRCHGYSVRCSEA